VEARSRFGVDVMQAPRSALVGREGELRLLRDAFDRARQGGEPQFVTLVGVPGIGKSRIVYELSQIVEADEELITWRQGRCLPYGDGVSFWALAEMVKAEAGVLESDSPETVATKLSAAVEGLDLEDADWVEHRLGPLLGMEGVETTHGAREEVFPAWRRFLEGVADRGPAVLVFEDLHWADEGLLDFLDELADLTSGLPLLVVCTARPELMAKRPTWGGGRTNSVMLSLPPLSADDTARLAHELLENAVLPAQLQQAMIEHSGGNPLYAEEFARMVGDRGGQDLSVPETVQGIIAARLDALESGHKRLIQDAAVIGKVFWSGAVAALDGAADSGQLGDGLRELERRQLVGRERRSSVEGQVEYAFLHGLVRDVAYGQIPRAERSDRHRAAAEWTASLGRPDDHAEVVAHHYLEALDYARASGSDIADLSAGARAALREAGERTFALGSYQSAVRYFRAALDLMGEEDPLRGELLYRCAAAQWFSDGTGGDLAAEAVSLLRDDDPETAARAAVVAVQAAWNRGDGEARDRWLGEVDSLLADYPRSPARVEALVSHSASSMLAGDNEQALRLAREALPLIDNQERPDLRARTLDIIGTSRVQAGDEGGVEDQLRAHEVAREGGAMWHIHHTLNNYGVSLMTLARIHEMQDLNVRWRRTIEEFGASRNNREWFAAGAANSDYFAGRWDSAIATIDAFLSGLAEGESHYLEADVGAIRAWIALDRDQLTDAVTNAERAMEVARRSGDLQTVAPSLCTRAYVRFEEGRVDDAVADFKELAGLDMAADGICVSGLSPAFAWLALDLGCVTEAEKALERSTAQRWAQVARLILDGEAMTAAEALDEIGHLPAAAYARLRAGGEHVARALEFYGSVGAVRRIREAKTLLAESA
jgi:tetratricopeptide (TPR) repeat protein